MLWHKHCLQGQFIRHVPNEMQHFLKIEIGMEMLKIPCEWEKVEACK